MTEFLRKRTEGYCAVTTYNGSCWFLPRSEFTKVRTAWLKGAAFIDTVGFHGDTITIKTANVDSIYDASPDVVAAQMSEKQADEADDSLAGGAA